MQGARILGLKRVTINTEDATRMANGNAELQRVVEVACERRRFRTIDQWGLISTERLVDRLKGEVLHGFLLFMVMMLFQENHWELGLVGHARRLIVQLRAGQEDGSKFDGA